MAAISLDEMITMGENFLEEKHSSVVKECMTRDKFGLSLKMGFGKTLISIIVGLKKKRESGSKEPILVIASKSLIPSWKFEIKKFFGTAIKYQVISGTTNAKFKLELDTMIVLVAPSTSGAIYKANNFDKMFATVESYTEPGSRFPIKKIVYHVPTKPLLRDLGKDAIGGNILFQKTWSCLIVDEGHTCTSIVTNLCQSICVLASPNRMILSGTLFDEPKFERILGYYKILHLPDFPNDIPETVAFLKSPNFKGTNKTIIHRNDNIEVLDFKINKHIIQHDLTPDEGKIYVSMKETLQILRNYCQKYAKPADRKRFSTYILAMITYIRQSVVIPALPVSNITLEMSDLSEQRSDLTILLMKQFQKLNIEEFLSKKESVRSSRISETLKIICKHNKPTDKMIVFSCFRTSLDMLTHFIEEEVDIDVYKLESTLSINARGDLIETFNSSQKNSVLLTTYELGAEGLNLQSANVVIILDFWWNQAKVSQAIARIARRDQKAAEIDIYFMTSNTGIEKALFVKQQDKILLLDEINNGKIKSKVKTIKMDEILKLVDSHDENYTYLDKFY